MVKSRHQFTHQNVTFFISTCVYIVTEINIYSIENHHSMKCYVLIGEILAKEK